MNLEIDKTEIIRKTKIIDDIIPQLKQEFIGIDEQIDAIMENIRNWYLYSQFQKGPCVVNLFGMTGCGKTSLIRRIVQLLDCEGDMLYFNFCAINETSSYDIESDIEEQVSCMSDNKIIVLDEFQYAATIDKDGMEKDNKNGLKPFWELIDSGIIHKLSRKCDIDIVHDSINAMLCLNEIEPMRIEDGVIANADAYDSFLERCVGGDLTDTFCFSKSSQNFFIVGYWFNKIVQIYNRCFGVDMMKYELMNQFCNMNADEILELFKSMEKECKKGYDLNFSKSIIFVIANVDEAFNIAYNVNPDMSPNQFYEITKKISIVEIKKALQKRFRNEQIARLGNTYIIYPSFNQKSFEKIIDLELTKYGERIKDKLGIAIEFDKKIKKVIYEEAVYPTQGTRPIFSTINEVVETKLPYIMYNILSNDDYKQVSLLRYSYKRGKIVVKTIDDKGNEINEYKFSINLRLVKVRQLTDDESQADTAVHESGHFVVYSYLNGVVPEKIVSKSADTDMNGFMMRDFENEEEQIGSRRDYLNDIKVCLGGYVAEGVIFGEDRRSNGASNDLMRATDIASRMVRRWGLSDNPFTTTLIGAENDGMLIKDDKQEYINDQIKKIIQDCLKETIEIINKPHIMKMLKSSSKYLLNNVQMPKHVMNDLFNIAKKEGEMCENNSRYYRDIVSAFE